MSQRRIEESHRRISSARHEKQKALSICGRNVCDDEDCPIVATTWYAMKAKGQTMNCEESQEGRELVPPLHVGIPVQFFRLQDISKKRCHVKGRYYRFLNRFLYLLGTAVHNFTSTGYYQCTCIMRKSF